ncbi:MAG TPA: FtsQ-type POTRA domain-containing protein, partial [Bacteroidetes bacterium]|nr:FtsQ-type POTRA domain-containing protein [Bacteroidota bacterium]
MLVKKITKSIVILTIAAGLFLLGNKLVEWMNHSTTLRLSDVDVEGNRLVTTDEILKLAPVRKGQNITGIDLLDIQKAIEVHPYIETALVSRRFPSTLRIDIVERVPVAFLNGTHLFAVDETGFLLPRLKSVALHGLPIIT